MNRVISKKKYLRKITLLLLWIASAHAMAGTLPGSFRITGLPASVNMDLFTATILKSDFEPFRYRNHNVVLVFTNGIKVELISAAELAVQGAKIDLNIYKENDTPGYLPPVFIFNEDGTISALFQKTGQKSETIKRIGE